MTEGTEPIIRKSTPGHGGARPGAGRKPKTDQVDAYAVLAKAKAKQMMFKAHREELAYHKEAGEVYERAQVLQTFATTLAILAEQVRAIPDLLERRAGATPRQCELAAEEIDTQLEAARKALMSVLGEGGAPPDV